MSGERPQPHWSEAIGKLHENAAYVDSQAARKRFHRLASIAKLIHMDEGALDQLDNEHYSACATLAASIRDLAIPSASILMIVLAYFLALVESERRLNVQSPRSLEKFERETLVAGFGVVVNCVVALIAYASCFYFERTARLAWANRALRAGVVIVFSSGVWYTFILVVTYLAPTLGPFVAILGAVSTAETSSSPQNVTRIYSTASVYIGILAYYFQVAFMTVLSLTAGPAFGLEDDLATVESILAHVHGFSGSEGLGADVSEIIEQVEAGRLVQDDNLRARLLRELLACAVVVTESQGRKGLRDYASYVAQFRKNYDLKHDPVKHRPARQRRELLRNMRAEVQAKQLLDVFPDAFQVDRRKRRMACCFCPCYAICAFRRIAKASSLFRLGVDSSPCPVLVDCEFMPCGICKPDSCWDRVFCLTRISLASKLLAFIVLVIVAFGAYALYQQIANSNDPPQSPTAEDCSFLITARQLGQCMCQLLQQLGRLNVTFARPLLTYAVADGNLTNCRTFTSVP